MRVKSVGIDLGSKKISWSVFVGDDLVEVDHLEVPKTYRAKEIGKLLQAIERPLIGANVVLIEEPLVGRAVRSSLLLAQTAGGVLADAYRYCPDAHIDLVDNNTWKKAIVGKGGSDKEAISQWLETEHEDWFTEWCVYDRPKAGRTVQQDRVDAICIGLYAVEISARSGSFAQGAVV